MKIIFQHLFSSVCNYSAYTFKTLTVLVAFWSASPLVAQVDNVSANEILEQISQGEPVTLTGKTIIGDLDFTQLDKKFRGGSYGARRGVVKEFFTKLRAPLALKDCTIEGAIITFGTEKKPGLLKENFVAFDELATFEGCRFQEAVTFERMTFYQGIVFKDCSFAKSLTFDKVHFAKPPVIEGGNAMDQLKIKDTNWDEKTGQKPAAPAAGDEQNSVTVILHNTTLQTIDIRFGRTTWSLSPRGKSSLLADIGTEIYLLKDRKKDRLLLTIQPTMDGEEFDMAKL